MTNNREDFGSAYADASIITSGQTIDGHKQWLFIYGKSEVRKEVEAFQELNGTARTLAMIGGSLGFYTQVAKDEGNAARLVSRAHAQEKEVWKWSAAYQGTDPIDLMFNHALALYKA